MIQSSTKRLLSVILIGSTQPLSRPSTLEMPPALPKSLVTLDMVIATIITNVNTDLNVEREPRKEINFQE